MAYTKLDKISLTKELFPRRDDGLQRPVHISDSIKGVLKKLKIVFDRK